MWKRALFMMWMYERQRELRMKEQRWASVGLAILLGALLVRNVSAWGDLGHQIICEIAFQELQPPAHVSGHLLSHGRYDQ